MQNVKTWLAAAAVATTLALGGAAQADLVAYWNFNGLSIATASAPGAGGVPTAITADSGSGSLSLSGWSGLVDDFSGSTLNALNSDASGTSLSMVSSAGNGTYLQISFSMAGLENLGITFVTRGTSTGFDSGQWSYSTDGVTFTDFGANTATRSTTFALAANPLTTTGLDGAVTAYLRYTLSGATSTNGNNRIDNLQLNATTIIPEPASVALLALGGLLIASRRRLA